MSIPITAKTYEWTPPLFEGLEGGPVFTFRHPTRADNHEFRFLCKKEGVKINPPEVIQQAIVEELKGGWDSEGMAQNITQLEALWNAQAEHEDAIRQYTKDLSDQLRDLDEEAREKFKAPPLPQLDFPADRKRQLDLIIEEVQEESARVRLMLAQNDRFQVQYPRIMGRMVLMKSTLDVKLSRRGDPAYLTRDCFDELCEALESWATENLEGYDPNKVQASIQLLAECQRAYTLTEDERKNLSSLPSEDTRQERSAKTASTTPASAKSKTLKRSAKKSG